MTISRSWRGRAFLGTSLDGFIAGPEGDLAFLESEPGKGRHLATSVTTPALVWETFFPQIDTLLMGRVTYETVVSFGEWAFPGLRCVVLSRTLNEDLPNVTVVRSIDEAIDFLEGVGAREVYVDGGRTVQQFLAAGLLNELTVSVLPLTIGAGTRLFEGAPRMEFAVRGSHVAADGLVRTTYEVLNDRE